MCRQLWSFLLHGGQKANAIFEQTLARQPCILALFPALGLVQHTAAFRRLLHSDFLHTCPGICASASAMFPIIKVLSVALHGPISYGSAPSPSPRAERMERHVRHSVKSRDVLAPSFVLPGWPAAKL